MKILKSTSRWQGWPGDRTPERGLSANLRADGQKQHSKAEPQGESAQHDEAHLDPRRNRSKKVIKLIR